jgi:outer membrane protein OmpA-like peptidoglycan-associated protein
MRKLTLLAVSGVLAAGLAGCMTYDPYTGEKKVSSTTKGAAIGAGIAAIGAYIDNRDDDRRQRTERMLKAAGVGAIAGGAVGNYMDRQEAKLRHELEGTGVRVVRNGDDITLVMPGNITFDTARVDIRPDFLPVLDSVAKVVLEFDKTILEVAGHTDSVGTDASNLTLSDGRATSVANYLRTKKVKAERLTTIGYGETRPVADNETDAGRAANRRVELTLLPLTD